MDRLTLGIAVDASRLETERFDEEVMRRRDVLVNQKWDDALELGHRLFLSLSSAEQTIGLILDVVPYVIGPE
jgi:hypothetical protein